MINITSILGETVYDARLTENHTKIDISSLCQKGIYFVMVIDQRRNTVATQKIVVN